MVGWSYLSSFVRACLLIVGACLLIVGACLLIIGACLDLMNRCRTHALAATKDVGLLRSEKTATVFTKLPWMN